MSETTQAGSETRADKTPHPPSSPRRRLAVARADDKATPLLSCRGVYKSYHKGAVTVPVLMGVDAEIPRRSFTAIVGKSGSGKTTLLHLLATLDRPDEGEIHLDDVRIDNLGPRRRDRLRNEQLGMVFQAYHLLPELTALENVLSPLMIRSSPWTWWKRRSEFYERGRELLRLVGLDHRENHRPLELSGGEMQRTAIARALMTSPQVLFADEPTGNLDQETGEGVIRLLRALNEEQGLTIVMVTHDETVARTADFTLRLNRGQTERLGRDRRAG